MKKIALVVAVLSVLGLTKTAHAGHQKDDKYFYEPVEISCTGNGKTFDEALKEASEQCEKTVKNILKTEKIDWYNLDKKSFKVRIKNGQFFLNEELHVGIGGLENYDYQPKAGE